jgi:hypothetical protein
MKLFKQCVLLLTVSTSAYSLNLPNKTKKDENFKPAGRELAADDDFKGNQDQYKQIALEVREDPKKADEWAKSLAQGEGKDVKEHREIEQRVASELKREGLARQYVLLIDKSTSMSRPDPDGGTRWIATENATRDLINAMFEYDMDHKVPVYLFGNKIETIGELTSADQVMRLFKEHAPDGTSTNLAGALDAAMRDHLGKSRNNYDVVPGTTIVVLTDGEPDSQSAVEEILKYYVNPKNNYVKDDKELAISFIQIGDNKDATAFLDRIDNDGFTFDGKKLDVCDTKKDDVLRAKGAAYILEQAIYD